MAAGAPHRIVTALCSMAAQRLELAALDVEDELLRWCALLAAAFAAALLAMLSLGALAAAVAALFWDTARIQALLGIALAFALAGGALTWRLARSLRDKPAFLAATLQELRRDVQLWTPQP